MVDLPAIFGAVATFILKRICSCRGSTIHFVTDKIIKPSIKDCERDLRSTNQHSAYQIVGPEQKRPSNWLSSLRNDNFKSELVKFLTSFWANEVHSTTLGDKTVIANCGNYCYSFCVEQGELLKREQAEAVQGSSTSGVVVTTRDFQAGRPGFKPWSDLYLRS